MRTLLQQGEDEDEKMEFGINAEFSWGHMRKS